MSTVEYSSKLIINLPKNLTYERFSVGPMQDVAQGLPRSQPNPMLKFIREAVWLDNILIYPVAWRELAIRVLELGKLG